MDERQRQEGKASCRPSSFCTHRSSLPLPWWRRFFESPHSLRLAFFPSEHVTREQVAALDRLIAPWRPRMVLDLCCGPGRHLIPLAELGYPMVGLDAASLMVERAREQAQRREVPARLVRGDAQRLPFREAAFDVVLCLFNSFGYLQTDDENAEIIREVSRCLRPEGRFLLDTRNRHYQFSHLPFSEVISLDGGGAVWLECDRDPEGKRLISQFRSPATGEVLHEASIRVYPLEELQHLFAEAGLDIERIGSGYDWRPFGARSRELLILGRRRGTATHSRKTRNSGVSANGWLSLFSLTGRPPSGRGSGGWRRGRSGCAE